MIEPFQAQLGGLVEEIRTMSAELNGGGRKAEVQLGMQNLATAFEEMSASRIRGALSHIEHRARTYFGDKVGTNEGLESGEGPVRTITRVLFMGAGFYQYYSQVQRSFDFV